MILYVFHDHPSVTQTFVVQEASALAELGTDVIGYALARGSASKAAAPLEMVCPPPTTGRLLRRLPQVLSKLPRLVREAVRYRMRASEFARLLLAQLHAEELERNCRQRGIRHVHAHFLARTSDVADATARALGVRWSATAHAGDAYAPREAHLFQRRLDHVAGVASANAGVSDQLTRYGFDAERPSDVIHCGVSTARLPFDPTWAVPEVPHLVTIGRLVATKGHWTILRAAGSLRDRGVRFRWTIAGDGPLYDAMTAQLDQEGLGAQVALVGALDHAEALDLMKTATLFVLPCERAKDGSSDGIPVVLMESMALGKPVVTSPIAGIPELVEDGVSGFLVPPSDSANLTQAIVRVLGLPSAELDRVRQAARATIVSRFDRISEAQRMQSFLARVAG